MVDKTRIQKAREAHEKANKERADAANTLHISYNKIKNTPAFQDIIYKLQHMADAHSKIAKDGIGGREGTPDIQGRATQVIVDLTNEKRISELDKAAGLEEGVMYIERKLAAANLGPVKPKKIVTEDRA